jgi:hypothetical protein
LECSEPENKSELNLRESNEHQKIKNEKFESTKRANESEVIVSGDVKSGESACVKGEECLRGNQEVDEFE